MTSPYYNLDGSDGSKSESSHEDRLFWNVTPNWSDGEPPFDFDGLRSDFDLTAAVTKEIKRQQQLDLAQQRARQLCSPMAAPNSEEPQVTSSTQLNGAAATTPAVRLPSGALGVPPAPRFTFVPPVSALSLSPPRRDGYDVSPRSDKTNPDDYTSFHPGQSWLWEGCLAPQQAFLEPPVMRFPRPAYLTNGKGAYILSIYGTKIRDLPILPRRISTEVEGFRIEYWMRVDPRVQMKDMMDRMVKAYSTEKDERDYNKPSQHQTTMRKLTKRIFDFREAFGMLAPQQRRATNCRSELIAVDGLTEEQLARGVWWNVDIEKGVMWQTEPAGRRGKEFPANWQPKPWKLPPIIPQSKRIQALKRNLQQLKEYAEASDIHWIDLPKEKFFNHFTNQERRMRTLEAKKKNKNKREADEMDGKEDDGEASTPPRRAKKQKRKNSDTTDDDMPDLNDDDSSGRDTGSTTVGKQAQAAATASGLYLPDTQPEHNYQTRSRTRTNGGPTVSDEPPSGGAAIQTRSRTRTNAGVHITSEPPPGYIAASSYPSQDISTSDTSLEQVNQLNMDLISDFNKGGSN